MDTHPRAEVLKEIVLGATNVSSSGFPYISDTSFHLFIEKMPHLFRHGNDILKWLRAFQEQLPSMALSSDESASAKRAIKVLSTVLFTAGVTAAPDLWLLKQVLALHRKLGLTDAL